MSDIYSVTTAKAKLSTIMSEVEHKHKKVFITKKGKNIAVIMPFDEFIKQGEMSPSKNGLILAQGSLADLEDLDSFLEDIYKAREESFERTVKV